MHPWAAERITDDDVGKIVRTPGVVGGRFRFAGTRIWVTLVKKMLREGVDDAWILANYPSLTPADLEAARAWGRP
jgi:uncharacterized protein (DUF433 family)